MDTNSSYHRALRDLALALEEVEAVRFSPFLLNFHTPKWVVDLAAQCMRGLQLDRKLVFDAVAGIPRAGNPFARELARLAGVPYVPMEKRERAGKWYIALEKPVPTGVKKVLLVDDTVNEADSKLETIGVLRNESVEVTDVLVLVENHRGGRQQLSKLRCGLHSVFTITELLDLYVETGKMEPKLRDTIHTNLAT